MAAPGSSASKAPPPHDVGADLPEPEQRATHSAWFVVQMPKGLHNELARRADDERVSLNGLIVGLLAGGVGSRRNDEPEATERPAPESPAPARRRLLSIAIVANIVVVALAAAVAIALLVVVLAHGVN